MSEDSLLQDARDRLAVTCTMIEERLAQVERENPGAEQKLAIISVWPDGSGQLAAQWENADFLADIRAVVGPDPRTEDERAADRILATFGVGC